MSSHSAFNGGRPRRPLVGVSANTREIAGVPFHTVLDKYLLALTDHAGCDAVLIPALGDVNRAGRLDLEQVIDRLDGILLTGARSMVRPVEYGGVAGAPDTLHDPGRDATTLPLARLAVAMRVPLLGICLGLQEICCAFGGTLDTDVAAGEHRMNHRAPQDVAYEEKYLPSHWVQAVPGGVLSRIAQAAGSSDRFRVNSLHVQGVATTGPRLVVEAHADDGLVEAISVAGAGAFALGVQWHPEWHLDSQPVNRALFAHFAAACQARLAQRGRG